MRLVLRALGHECIAVGDTLTALGLAEAFEPDLIVYDWNTVSRERVGLSIHFRDRLGLRAARIVVLSMLHEPVGFRSRERIDAYLLKPLVPRDLFAASIRVASQ